MKAVEISGLRKAYVRPGGQGEALAGLDLEVSMGAVHGLLGPNGSGKTTTLRCLVGLVRPDSGRMRILGCDLPAALSSVAEQVGCLIESPALFGGFTGRRHLELHALAAGVEASRVSELLDTVGLAERADELVAGYSLGMKQRVGLALALLRSPRLLMLDEPTNGLDPAGIRDVRRLVREQAASGVTVILSSHLMAEVQQLCDEVTIIDRGRRVASGPMADISAGFGDARVWVRVGDISAAAAILGQAGLSVVLHGNGLTVAGAAPAEVNRMLGEQGLWALELRPAHGELEDAYLRLTAGRDNDEALSRRGT